MEFMTAAEVAARWMVSEATVRAIIRKGELPAFKVGRSFRIRCDAVEAYEQRPLEKKVGTHIMPIPIVTRI